jgi:hypothetical protein
MSPCACFLFACVHAWHNESATPSLAYFLPVCPSPQDDDKANRGEPSSDGDSSDGDSIAAGRVSHGWCYVRLSVASQTVPSMNTLVLVMLCL